MPILSTPSHAATLRPAPIRLYPTPTGYVCYGEDAEAAGPILGVEVEYPLGDFCGRVTVPAAGLARALDLLNRARETAEIVSANRVA